MEEWNKKKNFPFHVVFVITVSVLFCFFCLFIPLAAEGDEMDKKGGNP